MTEVQITTPRGARLAGTFVDPVDSTNAAVLFAHSFLADRHSGEHFDRLSAAYRGAGYATLEFDFSGCGDSDDDVITLASQVEDLHSASAWLRAQGFDRQILHAHSFGTLVALKARPQAAKAMLLTGMITGPLSFEWDQIFSSTQLDDLERSGRAQIPDDTYSKREFFVISKQTLIDLSMNEADDLLDDLSAPILAIYDADDEHLGLVEMAQEEFARLPDGSRVEVLRDARFGAHEGVDRLRDMSVQWASRHVPVRVG